MTSKTPLNKLVTILIASVWFANGLLCKLLDLVPRHSEIVAHILNLEQTSAVYLTMTIGLAEIAMGILILTGYKSKLNTILQISIIALMNVLEFIHVPDLLLWGRFNSVFAFAFILLIFCNEFIWNQKINHAVIS